MANKTKPEKTKELETQEKELEDQLKRVLADYQNLEKRTKEEKQELIKAANRGLILRLLPALDTLVIAQKHTNDQGLKLSLQELSDILEREGVKKIETVGKDFDPKYMEAVTTVEGQEGKVIEELKSGYMLNDIILRVAQVSVGHGSK